MTFQKNIVAINNSVSEDVSKILQNVKIKSYSNEDLANGVHVDPFNMPIDNCNYYILIGKMDFSRIKDWGRLSYAIGKKKIFTIDELNKIKPSATYDDFVIQFYEFKDENKIKTYEIIPNINSEITIMSSRINFDVIIRETASDYYKRCITHLNKNVFYCITPVINGNIQQETEWKYHNKRKGINSVENYYYRIEKRLQKIPNPIFIPDVIDLIKYVVDEFNKKGIKELLILPPLNEIDDTIAMEDSMSENDNNDYNGWQELGDEEMKRWDEETGGSWRIENDFG